MIMIQYYGVKHKLTSREFGLKATVETISKQLEYITKGHIAMQTVFKTPLFLAP